MRRAAEGGPAGKAPFSASLAGGREGEFRARLLSLAIMVVGLGAGFALGGHAGAVASGGGLADRAMPSDPRAATPGPGIDLDGDGRPDLARPVDHALRGVDAYGSGAFGAVRDGGRRRHRGLDIVAAPGDQIRAPIAGVVTRLGAAYEGRDGLTYVEIVNPSTHYRARLLYVGPAVEVGRDVAAGDIVGRAQDLTARYPDGMTNHVHVELTGRHGGAIDPQIVLPSVRTPDEKPVA